jgi:hypothetical protein
MGRNSGELNFCEGSDTMLRLDKVLVNFQTNNIILNLSGWLVLCSQGSGINSQMCRG